LEANVASSRTIPCPECKRNKPENLVEITVTDAALDQEEVSSARKIPINRLYELLESGLAEADVCPDCGSGYDLDEEGRILD